MKAHMIAAISIILLIAALGTFVVVYTSNICENTVKLLLSGNTEEAGELWSRHSDFLSAFIPHEEVDRITEGIAKAEIYKAHSEQGEYEAELKTVILRLSVIKAYDIPGVRSVF